MNRNNIVPTLLLPIRVFELNSKKENLTFSLWLFFLKPCSIEGCHARKKTLMFFAKNLSPATTFGNVLWKWVGSCSVKCSSLTRWTTATRGVDLNASFISEKTFVVQYFLWKDSVFVRQRFCTTAWLYPFVDSIFLSPQKQWRQKKPPPSFDLENFEELLGRSKEFAEDLFSSLVTFIQQLFSICLG